MHAIDLKPGQAASILLDRRNCRKDLVAFAARVPVPGSPLIDADEDARIPLIETKQAAHHKLILREMQRCMETPHGRLMICAPPGSAKSTYASVVAPTWYLGTQPDRRVILASYGDDLARRHGRRTRQLLRSPETMGILQATLEADSRAADEFGLTNGSEYIACGIMGGVTGNRAHGIVIDDPIKGREQADSQVIRDRTWDAYQDDILTRLIPGGWVVLINTRWHEEDLSGRILPDDWAGESGDILCRDGNTWRVLCLQAECQTKSDPMRREIGQMLWPEWFDEKHWNQFRLNRRTWSSLYQQRPAPDEGILFRKDDMATYDRAPEGLQIIGASDSAVTPDGGDWTEHGVAGIAPDGTMYLLDWWRGQTGPEAWIEKQIDMIVTHKPLAWFGETGPIRRAIEGRLRQRQIDRNAKCRVEWLPHIGDKATKAQSIIATAGMGRLLWPRAAWVAELQRQCLVFPAGSPDDGVDTLGLLGRGADSIGRKKPQAPSQQYNHAARGEQAWMAA
jgi:predicted phage terminase large subunit-like protein